MVRYDVDFTKLSMLLLPTFWRKGLLTALICSLTNPVVILHSAFMQYRTRTNYRLTHNGQVCYLRAVLNDTFDLVGRRISIIELSNKGNITTLHMRCESTAIIIPTRDAGMPVILSERNFGGINRCDFEVRVPVVLSGADDLRLRAIINTYKLASKRFIVTYISFIS